MSLCGFNFPAMFPVQPFDPPQCSPPLLCANSNWLSAKLKIKGANENVGMAAMMCEV